MSGEFIIIKNKRSHFDYDIFKTFQAGIVLSGPEIKSIRAKDVSLDGTFILIRRNEVFIINMYIKKYEFANNIKNLDETRARKLLLNSQEIIKISKETQLNKLTIVPIKLYLKNNYAKIEIGLGKGKKKYDKRETIKKRDVERKIRHNKF